MRRTVKAVCALLPLFLGVVPVCPCAGAAEERLFSFAYEDADIHAVIKRASAITGKTFLFDPDAVTGKVTILSPRKVTADEAFQLLQAALMVSGLTTLERGKVVLIVPRAEAKRMGDHNVVKVVTLKHANATEVAYALAHVVPKGVTVVPYQPTNSLLIAGKPEEVEKVWGMVTGEDQPQTEEERKHEKKG